jgi:predicted O-linked N-acetylglucosamine transferase (SPINDLY family)
MLIDELRNINGLLCPDWQQPASLAENLNAVLSVFAVHSALGEITLLLDTRKLPEDLQEDAQMLLCEVLLELSLDPGSGDLEALNLGITGAMDGDEWQDILPWLNFRVILPGADGGALSEPELAALPAVTAAQIGEVAVHEPMRLQSIERWGHYYAERQDLAIAQDYYRQYLAAYPNQASAYLQVSEGWLRAQQPQTAIQVLQQGVQQCPESQELCFWLVIRHKQSQAYSEARRVAQQAYRQFPQAFTFKLMQELLLPEIYQTVAEVAQARTGFAAGLERAIAAVDLKAGQQRHQALQGILRHTNFFLAYQGQDDRALQEQYGQFVHRVMAANYPQWTLPLRPVPGRRKIRVGYLSSFLCSWSGTILFLHWLKYANLEDFEIYAYHIGETVDAVTQEFEAHSQHFYHIVNDLERVCQQVRGDQLDVLIFPELGMEAMTFCIAGLRLAPVQCMAWGQPVTSGLPTVDYFLSSEGMEPPAEAQLGQDLGQDHYSETLVRLPGVGISYPPIQVSPPRRLRADFGLRPNAVVYLSSQAPYKYLPQHDDLYPRIALQVPEAQFMFLRAGIPTQRLVQAFASFGLDSQDYCVFSPVLPREAYFDLLSHCDVYLDTLEWAGGNTTLDAIAANLPVVTCPGPLMRSRHSYGFLKTMGVLETIATDPENYVAIAARLAHDKPWRNQIRQAMDETRGVLFDHPEAIRPLEDFLKQAIAAL